jgi:hypothetical protein
MDELIDGCEDLCCTSYDAGYNLGMVDGALDYESDNPQINEEKSNTEYATSEFSDCKTIEDFITKYNEIRNLSYTYM